MTYIGGEYSTQTLYEELREQALREKIVDIDQYKELIEDLVEEKESYGFFDDNEDLPQTVKSLMLKWPELEEVLKRQSGKLVS